MVVGKAQINSFWKNVPYKSYLYFSLALNFITGLSIFIVRNYLPPLVPLLYGLPEGRGQLVPKLGLLTAPLMALIIGLVNLLLGRLIKDVFIQKILMISTLLLSLLSTITVVKIILLVGFF